WCRTWVCTKDGVDVDPALRQVVPAECHTGPAVGRPVVGPEAVDHGCGGLGVPEPDSVARLAVWRGHRDSGVAWRVRRRGEAETDPPRLFGALVGRPRRAVDQDHALVEVLAAHPNAGAA